ncbi:MAG TPA: deoxyribonuclease V [Atribacteraceae bacterium]|nr:deoxyribonuclease V [Atribacteraceae bacterium]
MEKLLQYPFDVELSEAKKIQDELRSRMSWRFPFRREAVRRIAGVDVSYPEKGCACAGIVILSYPSLAVEELVVSRGKSLFPYIPGYLSFREGPVITEAFGRLKNFPQIVFFDGQGLAHPRRFGLACHLGVLYDLVAIGIAKKPLVGSYQNPRNVRGAFAWIVDRGERVGAAVRTRSGTQPVFVSPGHRIGLRQAVDWTMAVTGKYRIPEPTRLAHIQAGNIEKRFGKG